jgi:undecaprenyl-diphosphatase
MKNAAIYAPAGRKNKIIIFVSLAVLGVAAILCYFYIDFSVISHLQRQPSVWHRSEAVEAFKKLGKGWMLVWLLVFWGFVARRPRPALIAVLAVVMVGATTAPTKLLVRRPRPNDTVKQSQAAEGQKVALVRSWSFPSGDTAGVFAVTTVLGFFIRRRWLPVLITVSIAIGILRVLALAHYPSDVCAGAGFGILSAWLALQIAQRTRLLDWFEPGRFKIIAVMVLVLLPLFLVASFGVDKMLVLLKIYGPLVTGAYIVFRIYNRLILDKTR